MTSRLQPGKLKETRPIKLQRLQSEVLRTFGKFPRCTPVRDLHMDIYTYIYDNTIKLYRQQAEVIHNHENERVRSVRQDENTENISGLNLEAVRRMTVQVTKLPL
jgi:hypothetical protein